MRGGCAFGQNGCMNGEVWSALLALAALGFGLLVGWLLGARRSARASGMLEAESGRREAAERALAEERQTLSGLANELAVLREREARARAQIGEQQRFLEATRGELENSFQALSAAALRSSTEQFLALAEQRLATSRGQATQDFEERRAAIEALVAPMRETLSQLAQRTGELERGRIEAYTRLETQVKELAESTSSLKTRTTELVGALRGSSQQRGRWGEIALRNVVELAGLTEHSDFEEQVATEGGRPDLVVRLPGGRFLAVDAKAPLAAYLEAAEASSEEARRSAMARHARDLRNHVKTLAQRDYARGFAGSLDLVVLFLPGDPYLSAAVTADPGLQLDAFRSRVLIATPTTLLALLRTAAHFWQQNVLAENAQRIGEVAKLLYERLMTFSEHLGNVGTHLERATKAYNNAIGSFETRLQPLASRLDELRGAQAGAQAKIDSPARVETAVRAAAVARPSVPGPGEEAG